MFAGSMAARRSHHAAAPIPKNLAATALYIDMIKRRTQWRRCSALVCSLDFLQSMLKGEYFYVDRKTAPY